MSIHRFLVPVMLLVAVPFLGQATEPPNSSFYQVIRNNDLNGLRNLLKTGDVNAKEKQGATALVTAAAIGSLEAFQMVLDAGADVNAGNDFGITPLIAAAGDRDKVRMLLAKGAEVNSRSKLGRTALIVAAATAGSSDIVQMLLAKGADVTVKDGMGTTALTAACDADDMASVKLLLAKGAEVNVNNFLGLSPLMAAAGHDNLEMLKLLIAKGANVNYATSQATIPPVKNGKIMLGNMTALHVAAPYGGVQIIQALLDAGAKVDASDIRGMTPLMLAAASDRSQAASIRLLLAKGANPKAKDIYGATVEDWARRFNKASTMAALGLEPAAVTAAPAAERAAMADPRAAVEKSIGLLQRSGVSFFKEGGCASCHSQNLAGVAVAAARSRGARIDDKTEAEQARGVKLFLGSLGPLFLQRADVPGRVDSETFPLFQLAADGVTPDIVTDPVALNLARQQTADGSWRGEGISRAPMEDSKVTRTALAVRGLQKFGMPGRQAEFQERIARGAAWLRGAEIVTTEDLLMQSMGLEWAGQWDRATREAAVDRIVALQRTDGGWGQTPGLASDAYATGMALYTLRELGTSAGDSAYRRGVAWLLATQQADGSWHVPSRSPKFQPYFESGFPHGHDQWISTVGTAWGAAGLSYAIPQMVTTAGLSAR